MAGLRTSALTVLLCLHWHHVNVKAGTLFAVPGDDVFFNISISSVASTDGFIAVKKRLDDKHNVMVFLDMIHPPGRPGNPTIDEMTIPQVYKDHTMECKALSSSRPETNGFNMSFIWKLNGTILVNNIIRIVQGKTLIIRRLQREDRFDKFTCIAYDSDRLPSNESMYYQIDPYYGPSEELTLDPPNRTYLVEEGSMLASTMCSADCHPHCIFSWNRGVRHGAKLDLGVIDKSKSGIYRCTAQNPVTNVSFTTALEVILTTQIGTERAEKNGFPVTMMTVERSAVFAIMSLNLFCISQVLQN